jgi:hypothetical protein
MIIKRKNPYKKGNIDISYEYIPLTREEHIIIYWKNKEEYCKHLNIDKDTKIIKKKLSLKDKIKKCLKIFKQKHIYIEVEE